MHARVWIFCCASLLPIAALADTPVDFSGEWVASGRADAAGDKAEPADTPQASTRSGGGGYAGRGGMSGSGGMSGGGHHGGRRSQAAAGGNVGVNTAASADPRLHANALIIRQSEVVFDIAANGQRAAYRFDNRNNYGAAYGGTVTLTWAAPEMIIETHADGGASFQEHYSLSPGGTRLTLRIREQMAGEGTAREFTRAFVRKGDDALVTPTTLPP